MGHLDLHGENLHYLRLRGRWLEDTGFAVGANIRVQVAQGRLILEVEGDERSSSPATGRRPWRARAPGLYHTVERFGTACSVVSCVMRGTPNTKAVAAIMRSAGSPGNTSPRAPARSAISSVRG